MSELALTPLAVGVAMVAAALAVTAYVLIAPRPPRVSAARRRPTGEATESMLSRSATRATDAVGSLLNQRNVASERSLLEEAGVKLRLQEVAIIVGVAAVVLGAVALLLGGPLLSLVVAAGAPLLARAVLLVMRARRRATFSDQLDDALQLIASSLRAGHSLLNSLDSVAREADQPMSEEFSRIINGTRVGRDLTSAMHETAERMSSEDFEWVTQAVAINREVGGNLADVLDSVGRTIRERAEIRRQVKALAAEGKLSAYILMGLPFVVGGIVSLMNPGLMRVFTESALGYAMLITGALLLIVGGVWLRNVITIKF